MLLRPTRTERDQADVAAHVRGFSESVLTLGAPGEDKIADDMLSQTRLRDRMTELSSKTCNKIEEARACLHEWH